MNTPHTSEQKLAELVLYVAQRCQSHYLYGKVKLNKILFYSDFNAFSRLGKSITEETYVKRPFGPVPKRIDSVVEHLVEDKSAAIQKTSMPNNVQQQRVIALRDADLSSFSAAEIAVVDDVIDWIRPMSAQQISDLSHDTAGWRLMVMDEVIPYAMALLPDRPIPLTRSEIEFGQNVSRQFAAAM